MAGTRPMVATRAGTSPVGDVLTGARPAGGMPPPRLRVTLGGGVWEPPEEDMPAPDAASRPDAMPEPNATAAADTVSAADGMPADGGRETGAEADSRSGGSSGA